MTGYQDDLPLGLLARAQFRMQSGRLAEARADLEEVLELAESGEMKLYEAEAQLLLAAVCIREKKGTEFQKHIERASALVNRTGYHLLDADVETLRQSAA